MVGVIVTGLVAAWIALRLGGTTTTLWVDDLATPLAAALACAACLRARARHQGRMRTFWTLLGLATACWTVAEAIWGLYALVLVIAVPSPSWADAGYLAAVPLTVAALIVHPATGGGRSRTARSVLDGMAIAAALLVLSWTVVLGPLWRTSDLGSAAGIVTVAYPFGDVVIVFCIVLAIRGMTSGQRLSLWFLLMALLAMSVADSAYTYLTSVANYNSASGSVIDAGWVGAYLGIALAAHFSLAGDPDRVPVRRGAPSLASLVAPLFPVLVALIVCALEIRSGRRLDHAEWLMVFGLIAIVLVRQALLICELLTPSRWTGALNQRVADATLGGRSLDGPEPDRSA